MILLATTRQIVDSFVKSPLLFHPGEHFLYSLSHDVVAAVIEVVSGMAFSEYLRKNIWEPVGMKRTYFYKTSIAEPNLNCQHIATEQPAPGPRGAAPWWRNRSRRR